MAGIRGSNGTGSARRVDVAASDECDEQGGCEGKEPVSSAHEFHSGEDGSGVAAWHREAREHMTMSRWLFPLLTSVTSGCCCLDARFARSCPMPSAPVGVAEDRATVPSAKRAIVPPGLYRYSHHFDIFEVEVDREGRVEQRYNLDSGTHVLTVGRVVPITDSRFIYVTDRGERYTEVA